MSVTTINIAGKNFACDYLIDCKFDDPEAVYAILCVGSGSGWHMLDIGQAADMASGSRAQDWKKACPSGNLWACKYRISDLAERAQWEGYLREHYKTKGKP